MYKKNTNRTIVLLLCDNRAKGVIRGKSFGWGWRLGRRGNLGIGYYADKCLLRNVFPLSADGILANKY